MRRSLLSLLTALLVLALHVSSASACLWDREVTKDEQEFKSKYEPPQPENAPTSPEREPDNRLLTLGGGLGALLVLGGVVVGLLRDRKP
jgi:hypothetical protein